jgi:WD40 repeat protein/tRNA A-37 threonylcarbamoyl transferase component Bud32
VGRKQDEISTLGDAATMMTPDSDVASAATAAPGVDLAAAATLNSQSTPTTAAGPEVLPLVAPEAYVMIDEFARGGLGRIMRARDLRTGRVVAIKEMLASTADAAARFVREAMVTANLQHPGIVPVYEVGRWTTSNQPFYAMKLVRGRPLNTVIDACKGLDARLGLVPHVVAVADALAYAHDERVIHRDLKPHNVICGAHGETVVIDWGLARRLDESDNRASMPTLNDAPPGHTYVGAIMGTPGYMPPEQARGERVDTRADVYSIGAILYHALAGSPPYTGRDLAQVIENVKTTPPPRIAELVAQVPADLAAIVERAMAREPDDRYRTAAELAVDLRRFTEGQLVLAHRYTRRERVVRFVARHRAAVGIGTAAIVTLAVIGTLSVRNIVAARKVAETEKQRADLERDEAQRRLISAYLDRARVELSSEHPERVLPFAVAAAELGALDSQLRFMTGRAIDALPPTRVLPDSSIMAAAFVPGTTDVVLADQKGVSRWSPDRDQTLWSMRGQVGEIWPLDDKTLVVTRIDGLVLTSLADGSVIETIAPNPASGPLLGLLGSDQQRRWLGAPALNGSMELFDITARKLVASIPVPGVENAPLISPDATRLLVQAPMAGELQRSRLFLVDRAGTQIAELCTVCHVYAHAGAELVFATIPRDNRPARVVFADWNGRVRLEVSPNTTGDVLGIAVDGERARFALVTQDGTIEVRELGTGTLRWRRTVRDRGYQVRFDRTGLLWVLGTYVGVTVHDPDSGEELANWHVGGNLLVLTDDEAHAGVVRVTHGITTWPVRDRPVAAVAPTRARVRKLIFVDDGRMITGSDDGTVAVHETNGKFRVLAKYEKRITMLQLLGDGQLLVATPDATAIREVANGDIVREVAAGLRVEASPDGKLIVTGAQDGTVVLWDLATGKQVRELGKLGADIMAAHWSDDGQRVGAIDDKATVVVWDRDGAVVRRLPAGKNGIDFAFSHDGKWLARATIGNERALHSLVGASDRPLGQMSADDQMYSVMFADDDTRVIFSGSGMVGAWDVATGELRTNIAPGTDVIAARFSRDNRMIFGGGLDRRLRVWDVETGADLTSLLASGDIYGLVMSGDGARLAVLTLGGALVWRTTAFAGDAAALRSIAACRTEGTVEAGFLRRRVIDVKACNVPATLRPSQ